MKSRILRLVACFVAATMIMTLQKVVFMLVYSDLYAGAGFGTILRVLRAGIGMDMSMAGYLTVIPGLLLAASVLIPARMADLMMKYWYGMAALFISVTFCLDLTLYGHWGFKLDSNPVFYFLSSPSVAMASADTVQLVTGLGGMVLYAVLLWWIFNLVIRHTPLNSEVGNKALTACVTVLLTALLFIPIRGGVTVSTMNLSHAYHSTVPQLNHAAVNPAFSLLYSLTHHSDFGSEARYMTDDEADRLLQASRRNVGTCDSMWLQSDVTSPDIYVIILESFSSHLLPSLGGEPVAMGLDSIARRGLNMHRCYAPGFRTDRGIPAILSGYPCPPATSVMKYVDVSEKLPSLASSLSVRGYEAEYYYGGDINYTNQLAYLRAGGFDKVLCDKDWPVSLRLSKWGVHDGPMLDRVWHDVRDDQGDTPKLRVIQTSSSHEPFEVPRICPPGTDPRVNAFAYTDSCVTAFVDSLRTLPSWSNTLVVLTADHYGAYPDRPSDPPARHHIPLIFDGGALARRGIDSTLCSHTDIAPTLCVLAGADPAPYQWGNSLTDSLRADYIFVAEPDLLVAIGGDGSVTGFNPEAPRADDPALPKAWLQANYRYLDRLRRGETTH